MASWPSVRGKGVCSQSLQVADQTAVGCDDGNPALSQSTGHADQIRPRTLFEGFLDNADLMCRTVSLTGLSLAQGLRRAAIFRRMRGRPGSPIGSLSGGQRPPSPSHAQPHPATLCQFNRHM